jgi:O-antigen/teichoic acid export membrane protein
MELSKVAVAAVLGQMAQLGLTIALALLHSSLVIFTVPAVLCEVVILVWKLYSLPKHPALHYGFMWRQWLELIKLSVPLALGGALSVMYYSLDTVMLSKMQTFRAVAIYGISYKFAAMVLIIGDSIYTALFPILVKYWPEEAPRFRAVIVRTMRLLLVVGALITLEFTIFAAKAIGLLYGHHYTVGANAARLVIASECLGFFVSLAVVTLISMNRNVVYPLAALVGLVINFGINLWVIPRWSYMGAAWATLATEIVVLLSIWIPMTRTAGSHLVEMSVVARVLLCSAAAVAATLGIWRIAPWLVAAVVGAGVYVLATAVARVGGRGGLRTLLILDDKEAVTSKVPKQDLG